MTSTSTVLSSSNSSDLPKREVGEMAKIPIVDQDECTGCGLCEDTCSEVFQLNDDGVAEVHDPEGATEDKIQEAMDSCPVECIHWEDA
jgi:ferredoxin